MTIFTKTYIEEIAAQAKTTGVDYIFLKQGQSKLELWFDREIMQMPACEPLQTHICAFMPGIFRETHEGVRISTGDIVQTGKRLGWLEAGQLVFEITTSSAGTLEKICVPDGQLVGYGTRIATLRAI